MRKSVALAFIPALAAPSCGVIGTGTGVAPNDPVPSGSVIAQGTITGQNGKSVSGTISVYRGSCGASSCSYTVHVQNLSAPQDATLQLIPSVNGSVSPQLYTLRASYGTQNYSFSGAVTAWTQMAIHPSYSPIGVNDYGIASLTQTYSGTGTGN